MPFWLFMVLIFMHLSHYKKMLSGLNDIYLSWQGTDYVDIFYSSLEVWGQRRKYQYKQDTVSRTCLCWYCRGDDVHVDAD